MKKNSAESWLDEALDALLYHEDQRSNAQSLAQLQSVERINIAECIMVYCMHTTLLLNCLKKTIS